LNNEFGGEGKLTIDFFGKQDGAQAIRLRASYIDIEKKDLLVAGFATLGIEQKQAQAIAPINYQGILIDNFFVEGQYETRPFGVNDTRDQVFALFDEPDGGFGAAGWAGDGDKFDLGVALWDYKPTTKRWEFSSSYTYDTSSGANNVAFDAMVYEDSIITAGTGLNPATGNDDFILTRHENKKFAQITKRAPTTPVVKGDIITYTFEITNLTDNELSLVVTDVLPVGVTFEGSQNPDWRILSEFGASPIIERNVSVAGGQTSIIALQVRADQSGILKNKANLLLPHPNDPIIGYITPTLLSSSEVESEVKEPEVGEPGFDLCIQDDVSGNVLQINSLTGDYKFTKCGEGGFTISGRSKISRIGSVTDFQDGQRMSARLVRSYFSEHVTGGAEARRTPLGPTYSIIDRNVNNNNCACP
ncbi:MAG: DUF11 domain-containing protein, partial [Nitrososphaera sp.]|nr:DUF11 domain-containing protein [Nitrososphaera sp.]